MDILSKNSVARDVGTQASIAHHTHGLFDRTTKNSMKLQISIKPTVKIIKYFQLTRMISA